MSHATTGRRIAGALGAATLLTLPAVNATSASAHTHASSMKQVMIRLDSMPGSEAGGMATLTPTADGGLKVHISAKGMVPGMPHAQHIHGDLSGHKFMCPTTADDKDGDGFLTVEEGLPKYGGIHIALTTKGDVSPKSGLAVDRFPVADKNGMLEYDRTLTAGQLPKGTLMALNQLHVVQHGVDSNGNKKYDLGGLGESTFAKSLGAKGIPAEATDVATCGMPMPVGGVQTGGEPPAAPSHAPWAAGAGVAALAALGVAAVGRRRVHG